MPVLNSIWAFFFSPKPPVEPAPLQRPRKYARTTDPPVDTQQLQQNLHLPDIRLGMHYPQVPHHQNAPYLQSTQFGAFPQMPAQNQANAFKFPGYYGGFPGLNPWIHQGPNPYSFPFLLAQNPWGQPAPNLPTGQYFPPPFAPHLFPPPGYNPLPAPPAPVPAVAPVKSETASTIEKHNPPVRDHSQLDSLHWPTGFVRRESLKSVQERKWKHNKWAWRSSGTVQYQGYAAEVRACLGVLRCGTCQRLTRPKTQRSSRRLQIQSGCTSRGVCSIMAPLIQDPCDARTHHYSFQRDGETVLVWEHSGDHSTHEKPPGGSILSKLEEDQLDTQVMRKQDASAHELRTGDLGPGSVPLPDISPALAAPGTARYQLGQSQARLGINTGSMNGGLALMGAFADLNARISTPFIVASNLSGPVYITMQTPFMDGIIGEAVESWIADLAEGPTASRHGFVIDGDHSFFRKGPLLATCAFSITSREWTPVLYTWINGLDTAHHRPHFAHIFQSIIKHAGARFTRELLLFVMDFSGAQRGAHAEEYADAIISITPGFASLSKQAQAVERRQLVLEAEKAEVGCEVHFWRSADHVKKTHSLVPPEQAGAFERILRELLSPRTTSECFDTVIQTFKTTFPPLKNWIGWWERRSIASMIFPAKSSTDPTVASKVPSTSNPIEHQHSLLHHAVGRDHELLPGIEKIWLHVEEMRKKSDAIKAGHFNAGQVRNRRPAKPQTYEENDGRAPDTVAALAAAAAATPTGNPTPQPPTGTQPPPTTPTIAYTPKLLKSYRWDPPNFCFFDTGLELWFRAFSRWSDEEQAEFLNSLPSESALACFFYHFQRRRKWIMEASSTNIQGVRELSLGQGNARHRIFNQWKLYRNCASTWLHHAIRDAEPSLEVRLHFGVAHAFYGSCPSNHPVQLWVGSIQTLLRINLFDLRAARRQYSAAASLTDYFASCTPRILPGNDEGGTQVVHSVPAPACQHPDCAGSHSLEIETIDTFWPIILHINPDSGTLARLPIDQSFSIDNGSDGSITYELVGTTSFDFERKHWTSNVLIGDTTFHYDDLHNAGSLRQCGASGLISTPDPRAVLLVYHRTSALDKSSKPFRGVVSAYDEQLAIDASIPRRSPSLIHDTPPATPKNSTTPIPESGINAAGSGAAPFPLGLLSPLGEHQPEVPPPAEWCPCCRSICEHAADKVPTVRCTGCKYWHHIGCVLEADWAIDPGDLEGWLCPICDESWLFPVVIWNDELIGKFLMFQTGPDSSFYPARLEGLTSMDQVQVKWYRANLYKQGEIPGEGEFLRTKQQCAEIATLPADSTYYTWNVGRIEWPQRLTESAQEIYGYENSEISDLLYGARDSIFAIVTGSQSVSHPIWADYEQWMASGKRHNEIGRANEFAENFYSTRILPGDASPIESHVEYIIQCIQPDIPAVPDTPAAVSEALLRRVATLAPICWNMEWLCELFRAPHAWALHRVMMTLSADVEHVFILCI
ncbi:hypothetical protein GGX14DRAFT_607331 [Mycena pura]|uniref:Zinc finger PHD-type domain-containing protein n=1 Tax=Mycena pura TaxID=153505 RepID=A0AAD6VL30_9AGAR|nr:hypothetical protein GGX14DRAFT_607331 [Mycena pura]